MKAILSKTSEWEWKDEVEINTLDDLKKIQQKYGSKLIIGWTKDELLIEIYDAYRE